MVAKKFFGFSTFLEFSSLETDFTNDEDISSYNGDFKSGGSFTRNASGKHTTVVTIAKMMELSFSQGYPPGVPQRASPDHWLRHCWPKDALGKPILALNQLAMADIVTAPSPELNPKLGICKHHKNSWTQLKNQNTKTC
jgi:hypothetical protein